MILTANTDEYYKWCKETRKSSGLIAMFNGCFDIIHLGHIKFFNHIQNYYKGRKIVCAINSDESVKMQHKNHTLINTLDYRITMIREIFNTNIDFVIFDTVTPSSVIWNLMPDIIIKGKEYEGKQFPEKFIMEKIGGEIKYYDSGVDISTTAIIERIVGNEIKV